MPSFFYKVSDSWNNCFPLPGLSSCSLLLSLPLWPESHPSPSSCHEVPIQEPQSLSVGLKRVGDKLPKTGHAPPQTSFDDQFCHFSMANFSIQTVESFCCFATTTCCYFSRKFRFEQLWVCGVEAESFPPLVCAVLSAVYPS